MYTWLIHTDNIIVSIDANTVEEAEEKFSEEYPYEIILNIYREV